MLVQAVLPGHVIQRSDAKIHVRSDLFPPRPTLPPWGRCEQLGLCGGAAHSRGTVQTERGMSGGEIQVGCLREVPPVGPEK
ncbi:unnamed protein product [Arctogadus glacialis]